MVNVKPITEKSWLLYAEASNEKLGLLSETPKGYTLISTEAKTRFKNKTEIITFFNEDIFKNVIEVEITREWFIKGFPVNWSSPVEADEENELTELPLYTKSEDSEVYHCAGYYIINFPKGWVYSFCPKFTTINKCEFKGPYTTSDRAKHELSVARKLQRKEVK